MLNQSQKKKLLEIARKTLEEYLKTGKEPVFEEKDPQLKALLGVFVTLHKNAQLRGCIGFIKPVKPLYEAVSEMAISAATRDPRFLPVSYDELKDINIEISVLSPFKEVKDVKEIEIGKHGLYLQKGHNSGLLLPQVAPEQGWGREEFLENICYKAGLLENAWEDAKLYCFTAEVFGE